MSGFTHRARGRLDTGLTKQKKGAPGVGVSIPQGSPTCTVVVGRYILEVGAPPGTSISVPAQSREGDSRPLARALKQGGADAKKKKADVGSVGDAVEEHAEALGGVEALGIEGLVHEQLHHHQLVHGR